MTSSSSELIVMLTYNDITVENAFEIFEKCKNSKAKIWGFKEVGLSKPKMKKLFSYMKQMAKITVLEVVAYTEEECLNGAKFAKECNCDMLIGTLYFDSINEFCQKNNIKYMPFIGNVSNRPSILNGNSEDMIIEANNLIKKGVYGINLLGYRYIDNPEKLISEVFSKINVPKCLAGSIDNYEKLDFVKKIKPTYFTIGTGFFEHRFGESFSKQINNVCDYISKN